MLKNKEIKMPLSTRHLLGLQGVPKEDIQLILDTAVTFREVLERPIKRSYFTG